MFNNLLGNHPLDTPQRILDREVIHSDDDRWMLYEVNFCNLGLDIY